MISNRFGVELWHKCPADNFVISPISIAATLAMVWTGARGSTEEQMRRVLHLEDKPDRVAREWGAITKQLRIATAGVTLAIANRLFGERHYAFEADFQARLADAFGAPMEALDFAGAPAAACAHINHWVAEQTAKQIKDLLPDAAITALTRLVLVNAIYFLGTWAAAFDVRHTADKPFWITAKESKAVPTMHRTGTFPIGAIDGGEIVELPYDGGQTAMYVVIPVQRDGLARIERDLDGDSLTRWRRGLHTEKIALALPRFTAAPPSMRLDEILQRMGMKLPFSAKQANFSGMAQPASADDELYLSAVFHQAFVKTDEQGTVATAATAAVMTARGGAPRPPRPFVVDRPFVFFIADRQTGIVLFMGRITDPSAT